MNYLLDTCLISELIKLKPQKSVIRWVQEHNENDFFVSVLTFAELEKGITKLVKSKRKDKLQSWMYDHLLPRFEGRILVISNEVALAWGKMQGEAERQGKKLPVIDSLIAATAQVFELVVVTRNLRDIQGINVKAICPWED